jgi:hypothetical protein
MRNPPHGPAFAYDLGVIWALFLTHDAFADCVDIPDLTPLPRDAGMNIAVVTCWSRWAMSAALIEQPSFGLWRKRG